MDIKGDGKVTKGDGKVTEIFNKRSKMVFFVILLKSLLTLAFTCNDCPLKYTKGDGGDGSDAKKQQKIIWLLFNIYLNL